jgi:hypothetical protein
VEIFYSLFYVTWIMLGEVITRWLHGDSIGDVDILPPEASLGQNLIQELTSSPDEGSADLCLVSARVAPDNEDSARTRLVDLRRYRH